MRWRDTIWVLLAVIAVLPVVTLGRFLRRIWRTRKGKREPVTRINGESKLETRQSVTQTPLFVTPKLSDQRNGISVTYKPGVR